MKLWTTILALTALLCLPLRAGDKEEQEKWMQHAREKETRRAKEAARHHSDAEHMEKKYGWLKENHPEKFASMMEKRQKAAKAWEAVATEVGKAKTHEEITALKTPAYDAEADAEMARLELRAAGSESEWKHSAKKTGSKMVAETAEKLIENQQAILKARKAKMELDRELRQLETKQRNLEKTMRSEYEKARKEMHSKAHKK